MSVDRRTINILLAALELDQQELAKAMGYRPGYVANVFNGYTPPSEAFKTAFAELLTELLLGSSRRETDCYPATPLKELIEKRASDAPSRPQFYADLGISSRGWNTRRFVPGSLVDRICCALGVHPSALYPDFGAMEEAS